MGDRSKIRIQVPAKTFLFGEYFVLEQGTSLIATTHPYFECCFEPTIDNQFIRQQYFHEMSPAGKFISSNQSFFLNTKITFKDPFLGKGGFGGSTAEFISVYLYKRYIETGSLAMLTPKEAIICRDDYLRGFTEEGTKPSGADLVSQLIGGLCLYNINQAQITKFDFPFKDIEIILFKTNQKLQTHNHLKQISLKNLPRLEMNHLETRIQESLQKKDKNTFVDAVRTFSLILSQNDLVDKRSLDDISSLQKMHGVELARGCGAMGLDVIAIICNQEILKSNQSELSKFLSKKDFVIKLSEQLSNGSQLDQENI